MEYVKVNSRRAKELKLHNRPSIDVTGSVKGMKSRGFWKKKDVIVKSGRYYYNVSKWIAPPFRYA